MGLDKLVKRACIEIEEERAKTGALRNTMFNWEICRSGTNRYALLRSER